MTQSKAEQIAWRKRVLAMPRDVAIGMIRAFHNNPVDGCKCGQEHDWGHMLDNMRKHDAAQRAQGLE